MKEYLKYLFVPLILLVLFLINFFFIDIDFFATDIDRQIDVRYNYLDENTLITSSLIGFLVKDDDGIHYAKTCISGREENIKILKTNKNKYLVVLSTSYSNYSRYEILKEIKTYKSQSKTNILSLEKIRTYTQVDPLEVYVYEDEKGINRIKAPNLTYNRIDTPNVIYFEKTKTNNGYDLEVYYDSKNVYYIITPYNRESLTFLFEGKVNIPPEVSGNNIQATEFSSEEIKID